MMQVVLKERVFPQISVCHIYIKMNTTAREMGVRQEETAKNSQQINQKLLHISMKIHKVEYKITIPMKEGIVGFEEAWGSCFAGH
jgi:hypothetical protein